MLWSWSRDFWSSGTLFRTPRLAPTGSSDTTIGSAPGDHASRATTWRTPIVNSARRTGSLLASKDETGRFPRQELGAAIRAPTQPVTEHSRGSNV